MNTFILMFTAIILLLGVATALRASAKRKSKAKPAAPPPSQGDDIDQRFLALRRKKLEPVFEALENIARSLPPELSEENALEWDNRGDKAVLKILRKADGALLKKNAAPVAESEPPPDIPSGPAAKAYWPSIVLTWVPIQPGYYCIEWSDGTQTKEEDLTAFLVLVARVIQERLA